MIYQKWKRGWMFQGYQLGASLTRKIGAWLSAEVMHYLAMHWLVMHQCAERLEPELVWAEVMHQLAMWPVKH